MIIDKLYKQGVITPPRWLPDNCSYITIMGSNAYGVSSDNSDNDVYGFCLPPREMVFPHLAGEIQGFGTQTERFEQYQQHHVNQPGTEKQWDFTIYSIVKYFHLCMGCNPNMIDSLFTPRRCVLHATAVGNLVRDNRKMFLHKGAWHSFKGYAYAQMSKIENKVNSSNEKRAATIQQFGYDTKFAYHVVRLLNEVEQIMVEHDLDLERNREQLKSIRRGEWTLERLMKYFEDKEVILEETYAKSTLPHGPDEKKIKQLLIDCLEMHYGSLQAAISRDISAEQVLSEFRAVLDRYSS
jgi:predicted nucleotidyltransferase